MAQREPVMILKGNNVQVGETHMRFFPVFREEMVDGDKPIPSPWQSEIGLNEQAFDFSAPTNKNKDA